ncbi:MAG: SDR family oxidoreductase [Chloroflexi bacterium]|nr:SDR family oxidoreductase [Chloroflexota bacterium]
MGQLDGKVAIIAGGGSGIGKGIAQAFAEEGCSVVIAGRTAARLEGAAKELRQTGSQIMTVVADVAKEDQVKALFQKTMDRFGRLDILVNASGAFDGGRIDEISLEAWQRVVDANLTGPFLCTREAFRIMKDQGGGRILNIGSISAQMPRENSAPYSSTKFAIQGLTHSTALDGREFGIAASVLHPGNVLVERRAADESKTPLMSMAEMGRVALCMVTMPPETNFYSAIVLPIAQPYLGRG